MFEQSIYPNENLIYLCGKAQSGKSSLAEAIEITAASTPPVIKPARLSFADPIYDLASEITGERVNDLRAFKTPKQRILLQKIGDILREYDPNYLTSRAAASLPFSKQIGRTHILIDDARLFTELPPPEQPHSIFWINSSPDMTLQSSASKHATETTLSLESIVQAGYTPTILTNHHGVTNLKKLAETVLFHVRASS